MQSEQINELAAALAKAQGMMKNAVPNRTGHFNNPYPDLGAVLDAAREPLSSNGLSVVQTTEITENGLILHSILLHSSGQWIDSTDPLPAVARPQEMGSAKTYARRYSLTGLIGMSTGEDDDAEGAEAKKQVVTAGRKPKPPAPNVILPPKAPPHEVAVEEPAPVSSPQPTEAGAGEPLEDFARRMAGKGEEVFIAWYKGLKPMDKKQLSLIGEELRALMLQAGNAGGA